MAIEWLAMPSGAVIERLLPPLLHDLRQRLGRLVHRLVRIPRLGPRNRDEPVQVRVRQPVDQPAGPALSHRAPSSRRSHRTSWASQSARRCFPTPAGPVRQQHLGQPAGSDGLSQPLAGFLVADQVRQWHGREGKLGRGKR